MDKHADPEGVSYLAGDLWPGFSFSDQGEAYREFFGNARGAFKKFVESILLHEEIVVPTDTYTSLTALIDVLKEAAILDLLDTGILKFVRIDHSLAYIGNGVGLKPFRIANRDKTPMECFGTPDQAIAWAISGFGRPIQTPAIARLAAQRTMEFDLSANFEELKQETYTDVLDSPFLRDFFAIRNTDMDALQGIKKNDVKTYSRYELRRQMTEIETVLAVARTNLELMLAERMGSNDVATRMPVGPLLKAKIERCCGVSASGICFTHLCELADLPDVGEAVLKGHVSVRDLINLRESRNWSQFRKWFHMECRSDPIATGREYAKLLRDVPAIQSAPVRTLRFVITTLAGFFTSGALGTAVSAGDSFVLDRLFSRRSPKFFVEELRLLLQTDMQA